MRLIRNALQTPDGTILESTHRHDYKEYTDANGKYYMVDGGLDYVRRTVHTDQINLCEYDDAPHERQRNILKWGTYGKDGPHIWGLLLLFVVYLLYCENVWLTNWSGEK